MNNNAEKHADLVMLTTLADLMMQEQTEGLNLPGVARLIKRVIALASVPDLRETLGQYLDGAPLMRHRATADVFKDLFTMLHEYDRAVERLQKGIR